VKKLVVAFVVLLCSITLHSQKTRFGQDLPKARSGDDFPLQLHIYGIHQRPFCAIHPVHITPDPHTTCIDVFYVDVIANGKKIELRTDTDVYLDPFRPLKLSLGDYRGRPAKGTSATTPGEIDDRLDLLLPDNHILTCTLTGISE
jgi:hypothetical protein